MVRIGTRLAALEMIESGTTTYADMYYFEEEIARTTREAGLRGVLGQTIIQFPVADATTPAEGLKRAEAFIKAFKGDSSDRAGRRSARDVHARRRHAQGVRGARPAVSGPGASFTWPKRTTRRRSRATSTSMSPTAYLESLGFWGPRTLAAHGVWVDDADIEILKRRQVGVSHNPESNMKLASGTAPVAKYLAAGVRLGLGTDGAASNNDLDMFEAMRQAAFPREARVGRSDRVAGRRRRSTWRPSAARGRSGMETDIGSLERAKKADLILVGDRPRTPDAALRSGLAPGLRHPR